MEIRIVSTSPQANEELQVNVEVWDTSPDATEPLLQDSFTFDSDVDEVKALVDIQRRLTQRLERLQKQQHLAGILSPGKKFPLKGGAEARAFLGL